MIAISDWIVLLLLGSQWIDASPIFSLLGITALTQPVANTTGWLFIIQGRTNPMFDWGIVGSNLSVISIIFGVQWGAVGVAASYSISGLLIGTPILFWYIGRSGSVKSTDIYRIMAQSIFASLCSLLVLLKTYQWLGNFHPIISLFINFVMNAAITLLILIILPPGRAALQDF